MQWNRISRRTVWALFFATAHAGRAQQEPPQTTPQTTPPSAAQSAPPRGRITGVLFDSVAMQPITGATVQLAPGTSSIPEPDAPGSRWTTSLRGGRFAFDSVPAGGWTLVVRHARFDSLGIAQLATAVKVEKKGTARAHLAVPRARGLVESVCGDSLARDTTGYVFGRLRRADGARDRVEGVVRVQWLEYLIDRRGSQRQLVTLEVSASASGSFVACGVPVGGAVRIAAWSGSDSTGNLDFVLPPSGIARRELFVGASRSAEINLSPESLIATDSLITTTRTVRRGSAQLAGRITGPGGQPLANARVAIHEAGIEITSNADGRFAIADLPAGTRLMDVRAIGFDPQKTVVDLFPGETTTGSWEMTRTVRLDTVQVRALRARLLGRDMVEFEERRRSGMGRFLGPEQLTRMDPLRFSQIFFTMPGVRVLMGFGGDVVLMRGSGLQPLCASQVWMNDMRMPNDGSLDGFVTGEEVRAVEVYTAGFAPFQYGNALSGCGVILVWTGPRQIPSARADNKR